jgi:sulfate/thiosulfate-binding protein
VLHRNLTQPGAVALTLALLVAACGGSSASSDAPSGVTPTGVTPTGVTPTLAAGVAAGASPSSGAAASPSFVAEAGELTLVAYSTPKAAYDAIIPLFQASTAGADTQFETSYGASGDQSRAVESGLPADVVAFSLEPDITRLVKDGMVAADWNGGATKGMVTDSVVVLVVRKGNPKSIKTWDDLVKPGIAVIEPNPFTSGGARWNVMAAYGAAIKGGKTEAQATQYLTDLFNNIVVQDTSARAALQTFVAGQGDVMLAYENEAIAAQQGGQDVEYIVPDQTILIENPVAVTNVGDVPDKAKAFVSFLTSPEAQKAYAEKGYRPVVAEVLSQYSTQFPKPSGLFTIKDLGGWTDVTTKFFDKTNGIVARIELGLGIQP